MDTTHPQYQDQLRAIGQQVHALQHGTHSGPAAAVVALLLSNVETLKAWTPEKTTVGQQYAAARSILDNLDETNPMPATEEWTAVGHWENDRIVVEYALPGRVEDGRVDGGYWAEGLWADTGTGVDRDAAIADAVREAELEHLGMFTRTYELTLSCDSQGFDTLPPAMNWLARQIEGEKVLRLTEAGDVVHVVDTLAVNQ